MLSTGPSAEQRAGHQGTVSATCRPALRVAASDGRTSLCTRSLPLSSVHDFRVLESSIHSCFDIFIILFSNVISILHPLGRRFSGDVHCNQRAHLSVEKPRNLSVNVTPGGYKLPNKNLTAEQMVQTRPFFHSKGFEKIRRQHKKNAGKGGLDSQSQPAVCQYRNLLRQQESR